MFYDFISKCKKPHFQISQEEGGVGVGRCLVRKKIRVYCLHFLPNRNKISHQRSCMQHKAGFLGLCSSAMTPLGVINSGWHLVSLPLSLAGLQSETMPILWPRFSSQTIRAFKSNLMGSRQTFSKRRKNKFLPSKYSETQAKTECDLDTAYSFLQGVQDLGNPKCSPSGA